MMETAADIAPIEQHPKLNVALQKRAYTEAIEELRQSFNAMMADSRYDEALILHETLLRLLPDAEATTELRLWCLLGIGNAQFNLNHDEEAEDAYLRMAKGARELKDKFLESVALERQANLARRKGLPEQSEQLYKESINAKTDVGDYFGIVENFIFIAMLRESLQQWDKANQAVEGAEAYLKITRSSSFRNATPESRWAKYLDTYHHWEIAILFEKAKLKRAEGSLLEAVNLSRKALRIARKCENTKAEANLLLNIANDLVQQNAVQKAVLLYRQSLELSERHGYTRTAYDVQLGLAIALFQLKRYRESVVYYDKVRNNAKTNEDFERWASLTADVGAVHLEAGEIELGRTLINEALTFYYEKNNTTWQEQIHRNLLLADARLSDAELLKADLHEWLNLLPQDAFAARRSMYQFVGNLYLNELQDAKTASVYYRQSVEEAYAAKDVSKAGQSAALAAANLSKAGAYQEALTLFDRATEIFKATDDAANLWNTRNDLGILLVHRNQYEEACEEFEWCLNQAVSRQDRVHEVHALFNLAETKRRMGEVGKVEEIEKAISYGRRSVKLSRDLEDIRGEMSALSNLGLSLLEMKETEETNYSDEAFSVFERALSLAKRFKYVSEEAFATRGLARVAEKRGDIAAALNLFKKAADLWERTKDYSHCAEALAASITLQALQYNGRRFSRDMDRLITISIKGGVLGIAARGLIGMVGNLVRLGEFEVAADMAFHSLTLNRHQRANSKPTEDTDAVEQTFQNDLYIIIEYLVDLMEFNMSPEQKVKFMEDILKPERFDDLESIQIVRRNIELVRDQLVAQERYAGINSTKADF